MVLPEFARNLIDGKNFASISTLMADGSPSASVVWVGMDGDQIVFNTAEGRMKPKHMRRDARVAITVFDMENPYKQAMIRGRVVELSHDGADENINAFAKKYMDLDEYPYRQEGEQRVIVRIEADHCGLMGAED